MTATVAVNSNGNTTTAQSVVLPDHVTCQVAGTEVDAPIKENADKDGFLYKAKARLPIAEDDTRSDNEILTAVSALIGYEGTQMPLASHYQDEAGNVVVGKKAPRLNKAGEVIRPSVPMVCLWQRTVLGNNGGIGYQALVKLTTGKNSKGRYVKVEIDFTKQPENEFKPIGTMRGTPQF